VTEIPEHLLKRSKAAKAKADGVDAPADATAAAPAAPATTAPLPAVAKAAAAPEAPPPIKVDPPMVAAYKARRKIPMWAMAALSILPVWALMYVRALTPAKVEATGPVGDGAAVYSGCASCHGAGGEGGAGRALNEGQVLATFPHIEDQLNFVWVGSKAFVDAGLPSYGNPAREGGARVPLSYNGGPMPSQKEAGLTPAEVLAVVCHERYTTSGADLAGAYAEEYAKWCSPESEIYVALEGGAANFDNLHEQFEGVLPVLSEARLGTPAG